MKFLTKAITICSREEEKFDYKNNHKRGKSANFSLDNISKINYKTLVVLSYISSGFGSRKVQLVQRVFK